MSHFIVASKPQERSRSTNTKYLYIPYVINHGYDVTKENKNGDNGEFMVGHELARITIPIIEDTDAIVTRTGKSLTNSNPNEIISLVTNPRSQDFSEYTDDISEKSETVKNEAQGVGSYSYLDANGDLKMTKDISEVLTFGLKTLSLNTPSHPITVAVASKLCNSALSSTVYSSNKNKPTDNSPGMNSKECLQNDQQQSTIY